MHLKHESDTMQHTVSDPPNALDATEEPSRVPDRVKDDMASRRISTHIPAPLRKKKNEEQYKKFITPSGNPVVYLQQHMRSKSMSDLADEQKDEENHRAEINTRYEEMEKLKLMLKEDEDTWTSNLQNWKSRRRSVTEDARKRKQEREGLEKENEQKAVHRRRKTYKEIVEDKMRRDKELAQLNDHDEYEFVSPRSSSSGTVTSPTVSSSTFEALVPIVVEKNIKNRDSSPISGLTKSSGVGDVFTEEGKQRSSSPSVGTPVQYKYTTKVTALINHGPSSSGSSGSDFGKSEAKPSSTRSIFTHNPPHNENKIKGVATSTMTFTPSGSRTLPRGFSVESRKKAIEEGNKNQSANAPYNRRSASPPAAVKRETRNVPNVLMRAKNPNARKERPKSAHDLGTGANPNWSSSLPRNYHDYSAPKPSASGSSDFAQFRKSAFASRRNMWENISKDSLDTPTEAAQPSKPPQRMTLSREPPLVSKQAHQNSVTPSFLRTQQARKDQTPAVNGARPQGPLKVPLVTPAKLSGSQLTATNIRDSVRPAKVPLVSNSDALALNSRPSLYKTNTLSHVERSPPSTATLTSSGLSMTSPRASKAATLPRASGSGEHNALFDDMKICINQRPRSEKGFGFTVRGGDDGKPVIVDTVSPGGAADICQLCVSDEILAINEVPLADCKTQDDIVQLIVSSVITGNLSLNIRRYGKMKKSSPLRLSGTKVVMTPGGFVQVRSDKLGLQQTEAKTPHVSKFHKELSIPSPTRNTDANNNEEFHDDLPPPPTQQELAAVTKSDPHDTLNRSLSPLSGLVEAASRNTQYDDDEDEYYEEGSSNDSYNGALSEVHSNRPYDHEGEEELRREVLEAQKALNFEEVYESYDKERKKEEMRLRIRLQEEQRKLEEEEAQREAARKKLLEEARLEDMRVEEELRKIQARKMEQQRRRKEFEQMQSNVDDSSKINTKAVPQQRAQRTNGIGKGSGDTHWMIEEAERRRVAEREGKPRLNPMQYARPPEQRGLPDHVIQRLTERTSVHRGQNQYMQDPVNPFWNDPNAKATLL